jgi:HPt (histidine-containing phosphotransfer) domain-containing protein
MNSQSSNIALALILADLGDDPVVLDRGYLARFTLGNLALEREVLGLFSANAPLYLERLLQAETPQAWIEAAHTLRGASAALGINHLARLAGAAERLDVFSVGEAGSIEDAKAEVVATLREALEQALTAIDGLEPHKS